MAENSPRLDRCMSAFAQPEPTRAPPQPSWVDSALKFVPGGFVAGYVIRADETTGILPIFPANADAPKTPGSAFDRGHPGGAASPQRRSG